MESGQYIWKPFGLIGRSLIDRFQPSSSAALKPGTHEVRAKCKAAMEMHLRVTTKASCAKGDPYKVTRRNPRLTRGRFLRTHALAMTTPTKVFAAPVSETGTWGNPN